MKAHATEEDTEYEDAETGEPQAVEPEPELTLIEKLNETMASVGVTYEISSVPGKGKRLDQIDEDGNIRRVLSPATGAEINAWIKGALAMIESWND